MSEAQSLQCARCGGPFASTSLAPTAMCSFCGHTTPVPEQLRPQLSGYGRSVTSALQSAQAERRVAALPRHSPEFIKNLPMLVRAVQVVPFLVTIVAAILLGNSRAGQTVVPVIMVGSLGSVVAGFLYLQRKKGQSVLPVSRPEVGAAGCARCGAVQVFEAGEMLHACRSCGAALLPTPEIISRAPEVVAALIVRERLLRWGAERRIWATYRTREGTYRPGRVLLGGGFFAVLLVLGPLAAALDGKATLRDAPWPVVGLILAYVLVRIERLDRRGAAKVIAAFDTLVTEFRGVPLRALDWLDTWWAGAITHEIAAGGWAYHAIAFNRHGYTSLLIANTIPVKWQQARVVVLVAAWTPGISEPDAPFGSLAWQEPPHVRELCRKISSYGFEVEVLEPGIVASATRERVDHFRNHPERAVELAAVVEDVVELARSIGARPITEVLRR